MARPEQLTRGRRVLLVSTSIVAAFLTAGVTFGYSGILPALTGQVGAFSDACQAGEPAPCARQMNLLNAAYTLSMFTNSASAIVVGLVLDRTGPRRTSLLGTAIFAAGLLALAGAAAFAPGPPYTAPLPSTNTPPPSTDSANATAAAPAAADVAKLSVGAAGTGAPPRGLMRSEAERIGKAPLGPWAQLTGGRKTHLAREVACMINFCVLVPRLSSAIISAQAGAFEASALVLFLLGLAVARLRLPLAALSLAYCLVPLALAALAAATFPNRPFGAARISAAQHGSDEGADGGGAAAATTAGGAGEEGAAAGIPPPPDIFNSTLKLQLRSALFWVHLAVSAYLVLRSNFFIAAVNAHIQHTVLLLMGIPPATPATELPSDATAQIARYIDIFNIVLAAGGVLAVPLAGWSMERPGLPFSFGVTTLLCALCSAVQMAASVVPLPVQLVAFVAFAIARAFIYSTMAAYVGSLFGFRNFGRLYGINRLGGAFLTVLQYPLMSVCESSTGAQFVVVNGIFLIIELILTATFPYYLSVAMYEYFWRPPQRLYGGKK
ncbi:hypothetical protein CLOP_g3674 [Closterium sp. NIES-67]|nr:hypothetical protein CLOP_g3674 [Closterium sp. NIES-67]